jgi:hypothetical protein
MATAIAIANANVDASASVYATTTPRTTAVGVFHTIPDFSSLPANLKRDRYSSAKAPLCISHGPRTTQQCMQTVSAWRCIVPSAESLPNCSRWSRHDPLQHRSLGINGHGGTGKRRYQPPLCRDGRILHRDILSGSVATVHNNKRGRRKTAHAD